MHIDVATVLFNHEHISYYMYEGISANVDP